MKAFRGWTISVGAAVRSHRRQCTGGTAAGSSQPVIWRHPIRGPYADVPPGPAVHAPAYGRPVYGPQEYGPGPSEYGPPLLPPTEVYAVLRENGFSPLGAPRLRGLFYSISAIDRRGDDGRLVIDARDGRIVRFVPADHFSGYGGYGDRYYGAAPRPSYGPLEPMTVWTGRGSTARRATGRGASEDRQPHAAVGPDAEGCAAKTWARLAKSPAGAKPLATNAPAPAPIQQSAAVQAKPADAPPSPKRPWRPSRLRRPFSRRSRCRRCRVWSKGWSPRP